MNPSNNIRSSGQMQSVANQNASIHGTVKKSDTDILGGETVFDTVYTSNNPNIPQTSQQKNMNIDDNMTSKVIPSNNSIAPNQSQQPNDLSMFKTVAGGTQILTESAMKNNNMMSQNPNAIKNSIQTGSGVMKNGKVLSNIAINDDTQSLMESKKGNLSNFPMPNNNPLGGLNQYAQSIHVSKDPSVMQRSNQNMNSQFPQANIMSVQMSTQKSNVNPINASKKPIESSFPMPPANAVNQSNAQLPNNQSINPKMVTSKLINNNNNNNLNYNPAINNQSALNHPPNVQMSHVSNVNPIQSAMNNQQHPNMNLNSQQVKTMQSNFPQGSIQKPLPNYSSQNMNPQQQAMMQSNQIRQSGGQNQINNSKMNNSSMKRSDLRTSRNKSPPRVIKDKNGQIVSTQADNNGNPFYTTAEAQKSIKASMKYNNDTRDEVKDVNNNVMGTGFRFYGQITKPGRNQNGQSKTNQDIHLVQINIGEIKGFNMFGVLDGHGPHGHFVSKFCREYFIRKMNSFAMNCKNNNISNPDDIYEQLKKTKFDFLIKAFHEADIEMTKQNQFEYNWSGTTCNLVLQLNKHLICASVGDSRGILVYDNDNKTNQGIFPLSHDHKPDLSNELQRILKNGGMVDRLTDQEGNKVGPNRVFKYGLTYPGLAMSRSLGDFQAKECGVITEPQITEFKLNHNAKYMVICSDGVWEFLSNEDVRNLGNPYYQKGDVGSFCTNLLRRAVQTWEENDIIRDDITIVCVYFN